MSQRKQTVAVDFDGVIHRYSKGWQGGEIYDPPIEGAIDALVSLLEKYNVFILSSRDPFQIINWITPILNAKGVIVMEIEAHELFWNGRGIEPTIGVTNKKLAANYYIDDRAVRFTNWEDMLNKL